MMDNLFGASRDWHHHNVMSLFFLRYRCYNTQKK